MTTSRTQIALVVFLCLAAVILLPGTTLAQIANNNNVGSSAGAALGASSGTMIAAAMETVGYHSQADILKNLSKMIETGGALIFLCVAFSAILTVSMLGQYRSALWLLVGPPIFFFVSGIEVAGMTAVQSDATPPEWRFGPFRDTENVKDKFLEDKGETAKVSMVFHQYNMLISEISQKIISVFTKGDIEKQMIFMARQRTLEDLFGAELKDDAGVFALASYFMVVCTNEIAAARTMAVLHQQVESGIRTKAEVEAKPAYIGAKKLYCSRFDKHYKPVTKGPWLNFIYTLPEAASAQLSINQKEHLDTGRTNHERATCKQIWDWVLLGTQIAATSVVEKGTLTNFDPYAFRATNTKTWRKTLKEVVESAERPPSSEVMNDPCPGEAGASLDLVNADVAVKKYIEMVSGIMLKKILNTPPNQLMFNRIAGDHSGIIAQERNAQVINKSPGSHRNRLERQLASQYGEGVRYNAYVLIHLLPYLQGFLLYILALLYPFFALMIIIPGQVGQFFTWMALWAWAKSWDVGWAIIMVVDEIAWELMPKHGYFDPQNQNAFNSPVNLLEGAFQGDPGFSIGMYWTLLASMVTAVPIISAHALLGTKRAIASRLIAGQGSLSSWAGNIGDSAHDKVASRQLGEYSKMESQAMLKAQIDKGRNLQRQHKEHQENSTLNKGGLSQHGKAASKDAKTAAEAQAGQAQKALGISQKAMGHSLQGMGAQETGQGLIDDGKKNIDSGNKKIEHAYESKAPGGEDSDRTGESGLQTSSEVNSRTGANGESGAPSKDGEGNK